MRREFQKLNLEPREASAEVVETIPQFFEAYRDSMVDAAISAEKRAKHHSKVHVGCSILTLNKDLDLSEPQLYTGANYKLEQGMLPYPQRKCAEMEALGKALGLEDTEESPAGKRDIGLVLVVVTVSESRNTGEPDRLEHDVLKSCNQCLTMYEDLLESGRLVGQTIIYNIRTENGKPVAGEPITLSELLKELNADKEKRNLRTIQDLLNTKDNAVRSYLSGVEKINLDINQQIEKVQKKLGQVKIEAINSQLKELQRERVERILAEMAVCIDIIRKAVLSAFEEGVTKERLIQSLGLKGDYLNRDANNNGFSDRELNLILDTIKEDLAKSLPEIV